MAAVSVVVSLPTIQSMTKWAREAHEAITGQEGLIRDKAQRALETLYSQGMRVVRAEVEGTPLPEFVKDTTVYAVLQDLDTLVSFEGIQHETSLQRTLSKVYRLFTDLTWAQCWRQVQRPVWTETRDRIIANADRMLKVATSEEMRFEYRCAEQGAKCLTPADSEWLPFAESAFKMLKGAAEKSPGDVYEGLKGVMKWFVKNLVHDWYMKTWDVRWLVAQANTVEEFQTKTIQKVFTQYIEEGMDRGNEYAQGIVMIFMDALRRQEATTELKDRLFFGNGAFPGMLSLLETEKVGTLNEFLHHPIGVWVDRFKKARRLSMEFLTELAATQPRYRQKSIAALKSRLDYLTPQTRPRYRQEKLQNQQALFQLQDQIQDLARREEELLNESIDLNARQGATDVTADLERVNKELQKVGTQKDQMQKMAQMAQDFETGDEEEVKLLKAALQKCGNQAKL